MYRKNFAQHMQRNNAARGCVTERKTESEKSHINKYHKKTTGRKEKKRNVVVVVFFRRTVVTAAFGADPPPLDARKHLTDTGPSEYPIACVAVKRASIDIHVR